MTDDLWLDNARECFQSYYGLDWGQARFAAGALLARGDKDKYSCGSVAAMAHMDSDEPALTEEELV